MTTRVRPAAARRGLPGWRLLTRGGLRLITAFVLSVPLLFAGVQASAQAQRPSDIPLEDQFEVMLDALLAGDDPFDQLPQSAADILRYAEGFPSRAYFPEAYGAHLYSLSQQALRSATGAQAPPAAQGFDFLKLAALTGYAPAQLDLGARLALGDGLGQDLAQARIWFEQAAQSGLRDAQFNLALMLDLGQGGSTDRAAAAEWYQRAAEAGDTAAQFRLATLYERGEGVAQDWAQAAAWYGRAVEGGSAAAAYNLAILHRHGRGVAMDPEREQALLAQAALAGDAPAQTALMETLWAGLTARLTAGLFGSWSADEAPQSADSQ